MSAGHKDDLKSQDSPGEQGEGISGTPAGSKVLLGGCVNLLNFGVVSLRKGFSW